MPLLDRIQQDMAQAMGLDEGLLALSRGQADTARQAHTLAVHDDRQPLVAATRQLEIGLQSVRDRLVERQSFLRGLGSA